jgi:hypothetical protein
VSADGLVHASEAYQLAGNQIQDAVSAGGAWYLSCTYRRERPGELIAATPDASPAGTLRATRRDLPASAAGPVVLVRRPPAVDVDRVRGPADAVRRVEVIRGAYRACGFVM